MDKAFEVDAEIFFHELSVGDLMECPRVAGIMARRPKVDTARRTDQTIVILSGGSFGKTHRRENGIKLFRQTH